MSKTYHRVNKDDAERAQEPPTHKKRRETKQMLEKYFDSADNGSEHESGYWDEALALFEPINKKKKSN